MTAEFFLDLYLVPYCDSFDVRTSDHAVEKKQVLLRVQGGHYAKLCEYGTVQLPLKFNASNPAMEQTFDIGVTGL
uniref:Uncharacterized protein n=1 Tax=Ascaris lumbricoides TaxID=6252 RepID=A0A0M3HNP2_ASCLU